MITRIVLFKLKDEYCTDEARAEIAAYTRSTLEAIAGVQALSVGVPADDASEKSWDLSIILEFGSIEDVTAYRNDPAHRAYVDEYMRPRMEVVKAWNFRD